MRFKRKLAAIVAAMVTATIMAIVVPGTALANDNTVTATEVASALENVDAQSGLVLDAAQSAVVGILTDPRQHVQITLPDGRKLSVGLPNAVHGRKGVTTRRGAIAYGGSNGSANAAVLLTVCSC